VTNDLTATTLARGAAKLGFEFLTIQNSVYNNSHIQFREAGLFEGADIVVQTATDPVRMPFDPTDYPAVTSIDPTDDGHTKSAVIQLDLDNKGTPRPSSCSGEDILTAQRADIIGPCKFYLPDHDNFSRAITSTIIHEGMHTMGVDDVRQGKTKFASVMGGTYAPNDCIQYALQPGHPCVSFFPQFPNYMTPCDHAAINSIYNGPPPPPDSGGGEGNTRAPLPPAPPPQPNPANDDQDGDGWPYWLDCNDGDGLIHPGMNIDQKCAVYEFYGGQVDDVDCDGQSERDLCTWTGGYVKTLLDLVDADPVDSSTWGGGGSSGTMQNDSAVRGCQNFSGWSPTFQPSANACLSYCAQNGASACEWYVNGDCYVEFGDDCHVEPGYGGWSSAVLSAGGGTGGSGGAQMHADSAVRDCQGYSEWSPVYQPDADSCLNYCEQNGANSCEWNASSGDCYVEFGSGCNVYGGYSGWYAAVISGEASLLPSVPNSRSMPPVDRPAGEVLVSVAGLALARVFGRRWRHSARGHSSELLFPAKRSSSNGIGYRSLGWSLVLALAATSSCRSQPESQSVAQRLKAIEESQSKVLAQQQLILRQLSQMTSPAAARRPEVAVPTAIQSLAGAELRGRSDAKVALVEYSDFQCPYCAKFVKETFPALERDYIATGKVLLAFRNLPLPSLHPNAIRAAAVAKCAGRQSKFWQMDDLLFADQRSLDEAGFKRRAHELGLDETAFSQCLASGPIDQIRIDASQATALGISGTPAFLVGELQREGVRVTAVLSGAKDVAEFKLVIDKLLDETRHQ